MKEIIVRASTNPLRSTWTSEMASDLSSMYGIDLEKELNAIISEQFHIERRVKRKKRIKNLGLPT